MRSYLGRDFFRKETLDLVANREGHRGYGEVYTYEATSGSFGGLRSAAKMDAVKTCVWAEVNIYNGRVPDCGRSRLEPNIDGDA